MFDFGAAVSNLQNPFIKIYPNPVTDYIEIDSSIIVKEVNLFTLNGQLILSSKQNSLSVQNLPVGIYLLKVAFNI